MIDRSWSVCSQPPPSRRARRLLKGLRASRALFERRSALTHYDVERRKRRR